MRTLCPTLSLSTLFLEKGLLLNLEFTAFGYRGKYKDLVVLLPLVPLQSVVLEFGVPIITFVWVPGSELRHSLCVLLPTEPSVLPQLSHF